MSQFFNASEPIQSSANTPPAPPPISPGNMPPQQQMFHRKPPTHLRVKIFGVLAILLVVVALPTVLLLSKQQQNYQSSAHTPQPSVSSACATGTVSLTSKYTIDNVPSGVSCNITATDSQSYLNDSFSMTSKSSAHTKTVNTGKSTISPGVVTFKTSCGDGFKDTNQVSYKQTEQCITPTPKPTITPSPSITPKPTVTPTPSACVTPGQIQNVKVSCPNCTGQ